MPGGKEKSKVNLLFGWLGPALFATLLGLYIIEKFFQLGEYFTTILSSKTLTRARPFLSTKVDPDQLERTLENIYEQLKNHIFLPPDSFRANAGNESTIDYQLYAYSTFINLQVCASIASAILAGWSYNLFGILS